MEQAEHRAVMACAACRSACGSILHSSARWCKGLPPWAGQLNVNQAVMRKLPHCGSARLPCQQWPTLSRRRRRCAAAARRPRCPSRRLPRACHRAPAQSGQAAAAEGLAKMPCLHMSSLFCLLRLTVGHVIQPKFRMPLFALTLCWALVRELQAPGRSSDTQSCCLAHQSQASGHTNPATWLPFTWCKGLLQAVHLRSDVCTHARLHKRIHSELAASHALRCIMQQT